MYWPPVVRLRDEAAPGRAEPANRDLSVGHFGEAAADHFSLAPKPQGEGATPLALADLDERDRWTRTTQRPARPEQDRSRDRPWMHEQQ